MGICNDDATTYLRRNGYNVVRHPRAGINPLDLIGIQGGETRYLGSLSQLLVNAEGALPVITRDEVAGDIQGKQSSKLSAGIGISLLKSFLSALEGNVGADIGYQKVETLEFVFTKVLSDSVAPLDIGRYLRSGIVDTNNLLLEQYVLGNGRLFVIARTVKTSEFTVQTERNRVPVVDLNVEIIKSVANGHLKVDTSVAASGRVSYQGVPNLVFGFECFEVGVIGGVLSLTSTKSGSVALADAVPPGVPPSSILGDGNLLMLTGL